MLGLRDSEVTTVATGGAVYVSPDGEYDEDKNDDMEVGERDGALGSWPCFCWLYAAKQRQRRNMAWAFERTRQAILTDVDWEAGLLDRRHASRDWARHISIVQYLKHSLQDGRDGCVVITTPQEASMGDVRKELNFCKKTHLNVLGIVEHVGPYAAAREQGSAGRGSKGQHRERCKRKRLTSEMIAKIRHSCGTVGMLRIYRCIFEAKQRLWAAGDGWYVNLTILWDNERNH